MFGLTALELARIQFGFTISFHIIFPAISIGLASYLTVLEGLWLWKKDSVYLELYRFWSQIFAVTSRWASYPAWSWPISSAPTGATIRHSPEASPGRSSAYEVLTAFFLEAGFLGVMLFGWKKVGPGLHFYRHDDGCGRHAHLRDVDHLLQ